MTNTEKTLTRIYLDGIGGAVGAMAIEYNETDPTIKSHASALRLLGQAESLIESTRKQIVRNMRSQGLTWADIGEALGVSRQAAYERFNG